ncbi:MAG: thermonuclease family protein [Bacteroidetes bacterium]|nr:thermonuclease family protein [Bacteroidota bacterium]
MKKSICFSVVMAVSWFAFAENQITGKVISVIDGNTVEIIAQDNESYKIRLFGIDCPEMGQEFGEHAKAFLQKMILNKNVNVHIQGKDRWGNNLGVILVDGKTDPRLKLLEAGLAWTAERNPITELENLKEKAKEKRKGLWKTPEPTPPWTYRREQTMLQPKFR